jgi:hypothetical protein
MSQSLNRIRSLVTEIDQIQKQGQKSTRSFAFSESSSVQSEIAPVSNGAPMSKAAPLDLGSAPVLAASPAVTPTPTLPKTSEKSAELKSIQPLSPESRVKVQWSGSVVIELQLADSRETVELRQTGDLIEIHFTDGKAFHIPFKAVA